MSSEPHAQLAGAVVRIRKANGEIVGTGVFLGERRILTCAHVVKDAIGPRPPTADDVLIDLDFALVAPNVPAQARVVTWAEQEDIAGLELVHDPPSVAQAAPLISARSVWGHRFRTYGFPAGIDHGVWSSGELRDFTAIGWLQVEDSKVPGYRIEKGFSGGPVWDEELNGVAGIIAAAAGAEDAATKAAFIIPAATLAEAWPALREQLRIHDPLAAYLARVLAETRLVNLRGVPLPRDRSGRAIPLDVPLDAVYIRVQAIEAEKQREQEDAEQLAVVPASTAAQERGGGTRDASGVFDVQRVLGEYLYRRGEMTRSGAEEVPADPQAVLEKHERLVVLGAPGAGKSTLLRYLARRAAESPSGFVPILVSLRDYAAALRRDADTSLKEFAIRQASREDDSLMQELTASIAAGRVLWLLDALDESRELAERVASRAGDLPGRLILTSRPVGYAAPGTLSTLKHYEILPLAPEDTKLFVTNWFGILARQRGEPDQWSEARSRLLDEQLDARPRLQPLLRNPLLLTFLVVLAGDGAELELPTHRADLYRRYVEELFDRWESSGDHQETIAEAMAGRSKEAVRRAALDGFYDLGWQLHLAYYGGGRASPPDRESLAARLAALHAEDWGRDAHGVARAVVDFWLAAGLLDVWRLDGFEYLAFRHLTFQEYAVGVRIAQRAKRDSAGTWTWLRGRLHHYAWREPILMLAGLLDGNQSRELVRGLLRGPSRFESTLHRDLWLAVQLLADGAVVDEALRRRVLRRFGTLLDRRRMVWRMVAEVAVYAAGLTLALVILSGWVLWVVVVAWTALWIASAGLGVLPRLQSLLSLPSRLVTYDFGGRSEAAYALLVQAGSLSLGMFSERWSGRDAWDMARAVDRFADREAVPVLLRMLRHPSPIARGAACGALGRLGVSQSVTPLLDVLETDVEEHVREKAAEALGRIGDDRALPRLIAILRSEPENGTGTAVGKAVADLGDRAVPAVADLLRDERAELRRAAARILAQIGDATAIRTLTEAEEANSDLGPYLVEAVAAIPAEDRLPYLVRALSSTYMNTRWEAVKAMGDVPHPNTSPYLRRALDDEGEWVRQAAAEQLGKLRDRGAVPALCRALRSPDTRLATAAAVALGQIGDSGALPDLVAELSVDRGFISGARTAVIDALARIGDPEAGPHLRAALQPALSFRLPSLPSSIELLSDPKWKLSGITQSDLSDPLRLQPHVQPELAVALLRTEGPTALRDILRIFRGKPLRGMMRFAVAGIPETVKSMGGAAVPFLIDALGDDDDGVRAFAAGLLAEVGDKGAVPALLDLLRTSPTGSKGWDSAVFALGKIGDGRAVPDLLAAYTGTNWAIDNDVLAALGEIGDERAWPTLVAALTREDSPARREAAAALMAARPRSAAHALALAIRDRFVSGSVATTLGSLGAAEEIPTVEKTLWSTLPEIRGHAISALGQLADACDDPRRLRRVGRSLWWRLTDVLLEFELKRTGDQRRRGPMPRLARRPRLGLDLSLARSVHLSLERVANRLATLEAEHGSDPS